MNKIRSLTQKQLFLPIFCVFLVLCSNIIYDIAQGNAFYNFFSISIKNGVLYGRIIDILNRGSEVAILAIGMTLVVSCSAGTDISVGSVMSLCASFCCMLLSGYGVTSAYEYALPLVVCVIAGLLMGCLCGAFNGALVAYLNIQPMVATLILYSAARAIGLLLCNDQILYIRVDSFGMFGGYTGFLPTPIIIAALCILIVSIVLKKTAMGMYVQSVGINKKASRIAGLNSQKIIFLCYVLCGLCARSRASSLPLVPATRTPTTSASTMSWTPSWRSRLAATAWAAASSTWPAPSLAHTPSRPSRLLSTPWASPPRSRRYSKPSWS